MSALVIDGGRPLRGAVTVEGNKNAALPILAACLLTRETCVLENVPRIRDVSAMCELLEGLGARVQGKSTSTLEVCCAEVRSTQPDPALVARIRGSVLLAAPLLARSGRAGFGEPGGDFPGRRSVTTHRRALAAFGVAADASEPHVLVAASGLQGASLYLDEASVTATETALLAAACASRQPSVSYEQIDQRKQEIAMLWARFAAGVRTRGCAGWSRRRAPSSRCAASPWPRPRACVRSGSSPRPSAAATCAAWPTRSARTRTASATSPTMASAISG